MIRYEPVALKDHDSILGKDFNKNFAKEMNSYYHPFISRNRSVQLAKETWEYAVADSIPNGVWVGAGKNIIDVSTPEANIDVKGLSCNSLSHLSTEASILQNNKKDSDDFASLFQQQDFHSLKDMFVEPLAEKISKAGNLYVFCVVRHKKNNSMNFDVYYCLYKASTQDNPALVEQMTLDGNRSINVPLIDSNYGKCYLYIPKRRLELRVNMEGMKNFLVYSHSV
jgi:hypothetical protein